MRGKAKDISAQALQSALGLKQEKEVEDFVPIISDWLLKRGYSSNGGFERLLASTGRLAQKSLDHYSF